jgi:hypothetical protein
VEQGDACRLSYPDASFDAIMNNQVVQHIETDESRPTRANLKVSSPPFGAACAGIRARTTRGGMGVPSATPGARWVVTNVCSFVCACSLPYLGRFTRENTRNLCAQIVARTVLHPGSGMLTTPMFCVCGGALWCGNGCAWCGWAVRRTGLCVTCWDCVQLCISECARVLKPGGVVTISTRSKEPSYDHLYWYSVLAPKAVAEMEKRVPSREEIVAAMEVCDLFRCVLMPRPHIPLRCIFCDEPVQ